MCGLKSFCSPFYTFLFLFTALPYIGSVFSFVKIHTFMLLAPLKNVLWTRIIGAYDGGMLQLVVLPYIDDKSGL